MLARFCDQLEELGIHIVSVALVREGDNELVSFDHDLTFAEAKLFIYLRRLFVICAAYKYRGSRSIAILIVISLKIGFELNERSRQALELVAKLVVNLLFRVRRVLRDDNGAGIASVLKNDKLALTDRVT